MGEIGARIKKLRIEKGKTLKEIADHTGFSISFLSQLERGKSSATLESLKKISLALKVNPGYFFDPVESRETVNEEKKHLDSQLRIVQRGLLEEERMRRHNIFYHDLTGDFENPAFMPVLVVLKPDQNKGNLFHHPGQEFLYVLEGKLTVQIEEKVYVLHPSDSIMFDSSLQHYWYNFTDEDAKFICVNYDQE